MRRAVRLNAFAFRQFDDPAFSGTKLMGFDKQAFEDHINQLFNMGSATLVDGYAPFCKHLFVPNFTGAKVGAVTITDSNKHLLRSGYVARRASELPVLTRWFEAKDVEVPTAKYLDIILYSRAQIEEEDAALPSDQKEAAKDYEWGIVSVKAQDEDYETPMTPITAMRNSLGREEGGSGAPLDREAYLKAVAYWDTHAAVQ
ncbi:flagellar associated protein [Acanthamoeba castellanii str. Neff]|uniref:Flagellar associated protein n=1 Tax=Acanthamoeba castellanii (strain ATCC 30010 / Neff) TaxID=1257118 RepID=L8GWG8_ACACF|nr:flagellar associated protein [Acanthamoeba castellanii str. Neff]ELR17559.1 flagellar associated protein [Acanthamoeba castellanii str. Neff]